MVFQQEEETKSNLKSDNHKVDYKANGLKFMDMIGGIVERRALSIQSRLQTL